MKKYMLLIMVLLLSSFASYAYFPDQEEYSRHPSFTFREERPKRLNFIFESLEVVKPGYYPLIIYLSNPKGFRQKEHTWVYLE